MGRCPSSRLSYSADSRHDTVKFLTAHSGYTKATIVNGEVVARDGRRTRVDEDEVSDEMNAWPRRLVPR